MKINLKDLKKIAIYQGEARAIKTITASKLEAVCGFSRDRTRDTRIFSPLLYQLS